MPAYRIVIGTPHGNVEYVLETCSAAIARQATFCLSGCRVVSVEEIGDGDAAVTVSSGGSGPRRPPPLQAHEKHPETTPTTTFDPAR